LLKASALELEEEFAQELSTMASSNADVVPTAFLILLFSTCLILCMCLATMRGAADAKLELLMTQMLMTQDKLELRMTKMLDSAMHLPANHNLEDLITRLIHSMEKHILIHEKSVSRDVGCQTKVKVPKICSGINQPQDIVHVASSSGESACHVSSAETLRSQLWTGSMPQLRDAFDSQKASAADKKGTGLHTSSFRSTSERRSGRPRPVSVDEALDILFAGRCACLCICVSLEYVRLPQCIYMCGKVYFADQNSISSADFNQRLCLWPITGQPQTATSQSHISSTSPRHSIQLTDGGIIQRAQSCITRTEPPSSRIARSTRPTSKTTRELYAAELSSSPPHRLTGQDFSRTASSGCNSTSTPKRSTHISSGSAFYSRIIEQQVERLHVSNLAR